MTFDLTVIERYKIQKLKEIKKDSEKKAEELEEMFKSCTKLESKYVVAKDFITQVNTIIEIEKEIKETENKEKEVSYDKLINA